MDQNLNESSGCLSSTLLQPLLYGCYDDITDKKTPPVRILEHGLWYMKKFVVYHFLMCIKLIWILDSAVLYFNLYKSTLYTLEDHSLNTTATQLKYFGK